jgi:NAD(P)H-hydrate epimerase
VLDPTRSAVGRLLVADLGLPWRDLDGDESGPTLELVEQAQLGGLLPLRARDSHKGDFGHLAVVAGSVGMAGAARLAGVAALRSGAGLVTLAVPGGIRGECAASTPEVMTVALGDGSRNLGEADLELLEAPLRRASAVVLGPGLGASVATATAVQRLVAEVPVPLVLDADGLNALRGDLGLIARRGGVTLLTPHPGEMARLLGISAEEVQADRIAAVRAAAARAGCVVVLKGSRSLTCDPGGRVMINTTGNPGMATAGCGDVLAGVLGALLAAGLDALSAAVLGVWVHGHAGDLAVGRYGETSLIAGDLVDQLPESFLQLQDPDETNRENGAEEREAPRQRDRGSDSHG